MKKFSLPSWTKSLPNDACLNSKDISKIFGYKGRPKGERHGSASGALDYAIKNGIVPEPDKRSTRTNHWKKNRIFWSMGYLRGLASPE